MILYHKSNLVYTVVFPQFLIFQQILVLRRQGHVILYHKSNLVYTVVFPQFLSFEQNNSAEMLMLIFFKSRHNYFFQ